jgi:hypothetical protein
MTGPGVNPKNGWANLSPTYFLSLLLGGRTRPKHLVWARTGPAPVKWIMCRTWTISSRSASNFAVAACGVEREATLQGEKQLLSPAWSEVGGGLGSRPEAGGGVCGGVSATVANTGEGRKWKWRCRRAAAAVEETWGAFGREG